MPPYSASYFAKWYRSPHRVHAPADRARTIRMVVAIGDYMLGRPVRSVLDIGAGEGLWFVELRRMRAAIRYAGVDPSEYAVARYARTRHLSLGSLAELPPRLAARQWDLVVCSGVLNYLSPRELRDGLSRVAALARGVAFLELFTTRDDVTGDVRGRRPASYYRRMLRSFGFVQCGPHCYVGPEFAGAIAELEVRTP